MQDIFFNLLTRFPWFWRLVRRTPLLKNWINRKLINKRANAALPRPHPLSLWGPSSEPDDPAQKLDGHNKKHCDAKSYPPASYTSWTGLTDRTYTGRHLGPAPQTYTDYLSCVEEDKVAALFKRGDTMIPCPKSSALFGFFAQWFTDSFLRTDPKDSRKNTSNHEIDLCQIYGLTAKDTAILRKGEGGELKSQTINGQEFPHFLMPNGETAEGEFRGLSYIDGKTGRFRRCDLDAQIAPERRSQLFLTGLERGNVTPFFSAISIIFIREHNRLCRAMARRYPSWDDDRLFETARNTNIAQLLKIIIEDYINHLSSAHFKVFLDHRFAEKEKWYRTNRIAAEFDLLYRWHPFIPPCITLGSTSVKTETLLHNNSYHLSLGVEEVIHAAATQRAGRIMLKNTEPFLVDRADRAALKKSRNWCIRPFNEYREQFGLARVSSFEELTGEQAIAAELRETYGSVDKVELLPGLFAEKHLNGGVLGELMGWMVASDAFTHALTNPLLSKNVFCKECFSEAGWDSIHSTASFDDIVQRNANMGNRKAVFTAAQSPPGSYGLPIIGSIKDKLEFKHYGWEQFFRHRQIKHNSNVFKMNVRQPVIAVLDHSGIEPLFASKDLVQDRPARGYKNNLPLLKLTGDTVPSMYEAGETHDRPKALYKNLLEKREGTLVKTFNKVADEFTCRWLSLGKFGWADELEDFAVDFLFQWYLGTRPDSKKVRLIYNNIFTHRWIAITKFIPWSKYNKSVAYYTELRRLVRDAPYFGEILILARKEGLQDVEEVAKQIIFVIGMNSFLGIQNLLKSIVGELSLDTELCNKLRGEMDASLGKEGTVDDLLRLNKLPLLDKTLREILRLHPPVSFIFGRATGDRMIKSGSGLFKICKDELVMGVIPIAQRDAAVFVRPDQFDPHRYDREGASQHLIWPRGLHDGQATAENRTCPGKNVAVLIGKLFCITLLTKFEWRLKSQPQWDRHQFSLNVAAPKGALEVESFRHRAQPE